MTGSSRRLRALVSHHLTAACGNPAAAGERINDAGGFSGTASVGVCFVYLTLEPGWRRSATLA
jgi:hypothetical protein